MTTVQEVSRVVLVGIGATLVMDIWLMFLNRLGVQTLNFAFIGRWVGHLFHGKFAHASIGKADPIPHELILGWLTHYAVGVAFAGLLVGITGMAWTIDPTLCPAALLGLGTVAIPFCVMQPAMGQGFAASKTPAPHIGRIRSMANHLVFGLGLYLSASFIAWVSR